MITLDLTIPTCWQELTPKQLRYAYFLISEGYTPEALKTYCLFRWTGIEVLAPEGDGYAVRYQYNRYHFTTLQIAELISRLDWLDQLPLVPVRLHKITGKTAAPADLQGLPFERYIYCDNLYQGYLHTKNTDLLVEMAAVLYNCPTIKLTPEERISIFYWFASVKQLFSRKFFHFFTAAPASQSLDIERQLTETMNAQIRALTKGDITKEQVVLQMDVWRALTELDAQAADYEELKKQPNA